MTDPPSGIALESVKGDHAAMSLLSVKSLSNARIARCLHQAGEAELRIVRRFYALTRSRLVCFVTILINGLGNGWIYLVLAWALYERMPVRAFRTIGIAALSAGIAHALYAVIKRAVARPRPFERDASIIPVARVLDRYSFPSGHCMTATAVAIPVLLAVPDWWWTAVLAVFFMALAKMVTGHHYPSDILGGLLLGLAAACPVSMWAY